MKFQTKIILYYTSIALALSLLMGAVVYRTGLEKELQRQESALTITSNQLLSQMEDRLGRMEAIISYILSDPDLLSSMMILGRASEEAVPNSYILDAKYKLQTGLTTDYQMKNSYRAGFFNQTGFYFTSFVRSDDEIAVSERYQRMRDYQKIPYTKLASEADGKTVLLGSHPDPWEGEDGTRVYSLIKAVRGYQMGFLEVENTVESLGKLELSDPLAEYVIFVNGGEPLYESGEELLSREELSELSEGDFCEEASGTVEQGLQKRYMISKASSAAYPVTLAVLKSRALITNASRTLLLTALLTALGVFAFGLGMIILYSRILAKPILQLKEQIAHTSLENLSQDEVQIDSQGMDELEQLADTYRSMTRRLDRAVENEKRSLTLQMQAQFDTLQAQINPHFIYNILNIISGRGIEDNDDMICEICNSLAMMLRYSTGNKERLVLIEQELKYLENYLYLCKVRYGEKLNFLMEIDPEIPEQVIPKLTLQQFVENSLAHGFNHTAGDWQIRISGKKTADGWEIMIQDNGEGIPEQKRKEIEDEFRNVREIILEQKKNMELEIGGMGLVNTYARCLLFYKESLIFELIPCERGTAFRIGASEGKKSEKR